MGDVSLLSTQYVDKNHKPINHTDVIIYKGEKYIVMNGNKYGDEWTAYPCGNNPNTEPIHFNSLSTDSIVECVELV